MSCGGAPAPRPEAGTPAPSQAPAPAPAPASATPVAAPRDAAAPSCPPEVPASATLADRLDLFRAACGGVLLVTRDDGLHAMTPQLAEIAQIVDTRVRRVQARREGEARELYYFAADAPDLVRLDLRTGREEVLVSLPRLSHRCFTGVEPGEEAPPADPVDFIQSAAAVDLDVAAGSLCLDVGDRNDNMAAIHINFRADLRTREVEQRTTFVGEDCKQGAARQREPACRPAPRGRPATTEIAGIEQHGLVSPSGRWAYYLDEAFQQSGDYIYSAAFLFDVQAKVAYAVTPTGLVKFDRGQRDAEGGPPAATCFVPGEAQASWMPGRDLLILEGCGASPWLLVEPPGRVEEAKAHAVVAYP